MIHKISKGAGFGGCTRYVLNKRGADLIGGSYERGATAPEIAADLGRDSRRAGVTEKPVFHASLNLSPGEYLSDHQWNRVARAYLDALGFQDCPYMVVRHTDRPHDHIHIVASRVSFEGKLVSDQNDYRRGMELLRQVEKDLKLSAPPRREVEHVKARSTGEFRREQRTGEPNIRGQVQKFVADALHETPDLGTFVQRLRRADVEVRFNLSGEQVRGISFHYQGQSFRGSSLGRAYSWNALQRQHGLSFDPSRDRQLVAGKPLAPSAWTPEAANELSTRLSTLRPATGRSAVARASSAVRNAGGEACRSAASASRLISMVRNPGRALVSQLPGGDALLSGLALYGAFSNPAMAFTSAAGLAVHALAARPTRTRANSQGRVVLAQYLRAALADKPNLETFVARLTEAGIQLTKDARGALHYHAGNLDVPEQQLHRSYSLARLEKDLGGPIAVPPMPLPSPPQTSAGPSLRAPALDRYAAEQHLAALNAAHIDVRIGTGADARFLPRLTPQEVLSRLGDIAQLPPGAAVAVRPSSGLGARFVGWTHPDQLARACSAGFQPSAIVQDGARLAVWVQHASASPGIRPFLDRAAELAYGQIPGRSSSRAFGPLAGCGHSALVSADGRPYSRAQELAVELTAARSERLALLSARLNSCGMPSLKTFASAAGGPGRQADLGWTKLALSRGVSQADILAVLAQDAAKRLASPVHQLSYATRTLAQALGRNPASPALLRTAASAVSVPLKLVTAVVQVVQVGVKLTR